MSKPARKVVAAVPKRASKPRKVSPTKNVNLGPTAPEPFKFRYDPEAKIPLHGCPFMRKGGKSDGTASFWAVPAAGGYESGWRIGRIMGGFYLRAITSPNGMMGGGSWLSAIIGDLFVRLHAEAEASGAPNSGGDRFHYKNSEAYHSLRGQLFGFLEIVEMAAATGASARPDSFTRFDTENALRLADMGLTVDADKWFRLRSRLHKAQQEMDAFPGAELLNGNRLELLRGM